MRKFFPCWSKPGCLKRNLKFEERTMILRSAHKIIFFEKGLWLYSTALLLFLVTGLIGCGRAQGDNPEALRTLVVRTAPADLKTFYLQERTYLGEVATDRSSQIGFDLAGTVTSIEVKEGDAVVEGQALARLDTLRLEAARAEAQAALNEAQAALALAEATLERTQQARELDAVSVQQLEEVELNRTARKATLQRARAQLDRIEIDLEKSVLRAPFAGEVATRFLDEGTVTAPGQPVFQVTESGQNEIRVGLSRESHQGLERGQQVEARVRGETFLARIDRILPGRNPRTRTVQVIALPKSEDIVLREGDLVEVTLKSRVSTSGYWLPITALTESGRGLWSCYVAEPLVPEETKEEATHRVTRRELEVLSLEENRAFVAGSLNPGERVIQEGIHRIVPNQRVQLVN